MRNCACQLKKIVLC